MTAGGSIRVAGRYLVDTIAATALQHGLTLVTRDSDFEHVEGVDREVW
jgi:predicted nucleic acid-binding protein